MTKTWKSQQIVSLLSQLNYWPFCTYWRITKNRWRREKQQVSNHTKKHIGSANWISCMMNTWWNSNNEIDPEIDKIPLKPNKCMKKAQGSQYYRNAHNSAAQSDETWKTAENTTAHANWNFNIMTMLLKNSLEIDQKYENTQKSTGI